MTAAADRHLLFGLLALQNGLIDQAQLVAAFQAWTRDKSRPLAEHLVARGDLDAEQLAAVEAMVGLHVRKHGDVRAGASPPSPPAASTRESLAAPGRPGPRGDARPRRLGPRPDGARRRRPHGQLRRRHGHRRRPAVPRPAAARPRRPRRRVRGAGRRAEPRGGPQADPRPARRRPDQPRSASCWRPRSPAGWSTRASSRSTAWGPTATAGPYYAMRFIRGDSLKEAIDALPRRRGAEAGPRPPLAGAAQAPAAVPRRLQRDRVRPQPRRAAPRHQAGQHHRRQARRDAGRRLGPGQGHRPGRAGRRASGRWCPARPAAVPRRCPAAPWARRPT